MRSKTRRNAVRRSRYVKVLKGWVLFVSWVSQELLSTLVSALPFISWSR